MNSDIKKIKVEFESGRLKECDMTEFEKILTKNKNLLIIQTNVIDN